MKIETFENSPNTKYMYSIHYEIWEYALNLIENSDTVIIYANIILYLLIWTNRSVILINEI